MRYKNIYGTSVSGFRISIYPSVIYILLDTVRDMEKREIYMGAFPSPRLYMNFR